MFTRTVSRRFLTFFLLGTLSLPGSLSFGSSRLMVQGPSEPGTEGQEPKKQEERGLGVQPVATPDPIVDQSKAGNVRPEIVLQAGITSPQTELSFSPDGRLLASTGIYGNSIKLWEVASGRLVRQLESSIPSLGASSLSRPFRFSPDGKTLIAFADRRFRRWDVASGRELNNTLLATGGDLMTAILSEDSGVLAATNLSNSIVRLWDTNTGREFPSIKFAEDENVITQDALALSPNGRLLAVLTDSNKVSRKAIESSLKLGLFDVMTGRKTQTITVKSVKNSYSMQPSSVDQMVSLRFSSDGTLLAVRDESSLKVWDVASAQKSKDISLVGISAMGSDPSLAMFASRFLFSPDRRTVAIVSNATQINLLDTSGTSSRNLSGHDGNIVGLTFSSDGKLLASSGVDNRIKVWDVSTAQELRTLSGAAMPVNAIGFSADGRSLAVAGKTGTSFWELTTGGVRRALHLPEDFSHTMQEGLQDKGPTLSPDGKLMTAGSGSQPIVKVWDVATGRELPAVSLAEGKSLGSAAFTSDGKLLAVLETNNRQRDKTAAPQPSPTNTPDLTAMPDLSKMMEEARKNPKKMQQQMEKVQEAMNKGDLGAGFSMLESMGVMPGAGKVNKPPNNLRVIDVTSGRQVHTFPVAGGFLSNLTGDSMMSSSAVAFSPDNRILASAAGFNAPVILRDTVSGQELRTLKSSSLSVNALAWSNDGRRLASAHWGTTRNLADPQAADSFSFEDMIFSVKVWDPQTGAELNSLSGHHNFISSLAFSPDTKILASAGQDSTIKLWDLTSGRELRTLVGHTGSIAALDFSPDGKFVVSGGDDGSTRLWDTQSGKLLATLVSLNKGDDWLVVTPDGLFDGSPAGWGQILWRFTPALFDVSPVEIFFNEYFHPGLLTDILSGKKLETTIDISHRDRRQPKLTLNFDNVPSSSAPNRTLTARINISDAPAGARDLRLFRNGSLVKAWRGDLLKGSGNTTLETPVKLVSGDNVFTAYAFNNDNIKSGDAQVLLKGPEEPKRPGKFHLVVVGVNQYANPAYNLKYAVADARAFGEEVAKEQQRLGQFGQVEVTSLLDQTATKTNLLYVLERLSGAPDLKLPVGAPTELSQITAAEPEDAVVLYFAGHGTAQQQRFYLIPHDLGYTGERTALDAAGLREILAHSVSDLELEQAFESIDAGVILMVVDACNSGQALEAEEKRRGPMNSKGLAQLAYEKGMYILTAAQSYQAALEAEQLGHGFLTYALIQEGLKSAMADDEPKDGKVLVREWLDFATERVPRMQEAKMREARGLNLSIAFVEGEEKLTDVDQRTLQRPRVFYRRELEARPLIVAESSKQ